MVKQQTTSLLILIYECVPKPMPIVIFFKPFWMVLSLCFIPNFCISNWIRIFSSFHWINDTNVCMHSNSNDILQKRKLVTNMRECKGIDFREIVSWIIDYYIRLKPDIFANQSMYRHFVLIDRYKITWNRKAKVKDNSRTTKNFCFKDI